MTERQERDLEKLTSLEDYIELIKSLDELAGEVANGEAVDKQIVDSITCVGKAMREKVKYIVKISKPYRKKQSWRSRRRDLKEEKEAEELEREFEELEKQSEQIQITNPDKILLNEQKGVEKKALECSETDTEVIDEQIFEEKTEVQTPSGPQEECMMF